MYTFGGVLFVVVDAPRGVRVHHPRVLRASFVAVVVVDDVFVDVLFLLVGILSGELFPSSHPAGLFSVKKETTYIHTPRGVAPRGFSLLLKNIAPVYDVEVLPRSNLRAISDPP